MKTLLVEDEAASRLLLLELLREHGLVDSVVNGKEAILLFEAALKNGKPYELVCMDIMMPEMDGREALRQIRQLEAQHNIHGLESVKVIMTTALGDSVNVFGAFKEQCDGYLVKPIDTSKLWDLLRELKLIQR